VRHQPFEVAEEAAAHAEEAHADDGHLELGYGGLQRGRSDEEGGRGHEPDPAADGGDAQSHRRHNLPAERAQKPQESRQGRHGARP